MAKNENGAEVRTYIIFTQVEHKPGFGYIYEILYDKQIHYNVFKERYIENDEGATIVTYPNDDAFRENEWQWAWTTMTLDEAKEILNNFENIFK
jgi:hypothetical protein